MKGIILFHNSSCFPLAKGEIQANRSLVDLRPSSVKVFAVNVDTATKPTEQNSSRKRKPRWRNKTKAATKLQNSGLAHMLPETDGLISTNHLDILSALSLCDERNSKEVVPLGVGKTVNEEHKSAGYSHNLLFRMPVNCSRKKLLILDLNGLLADIVTPPPKECKADKRIAGRAGENYF